MLANKMNELINALRRSIHEYRFRGIKGLRQELFSIFEKLQRGFDLVREERESPQVKKFWEIVGRVDSISSLALKVPALLSSVAYVLPALSEAVQKIAK